MLFRSAISGSQDAGDANVVAMLEALVSNNSLFPPDLPTKMAVFRTFLQVLGEEAAKTSKLAVVKAVSPAHEAAERHLGLISLEPREAFLLVTVEGFSTSEAAVVLDTTPERVSELIDQAGKEIASLE